MHVPSTATAADAMAERKELLAGNTLLKQERDRLRDEHDLWARAVSAIKERYAAHTAADMPIQEVADLVRANFRKHKEELTAEIRNLEISRDSARSEIIALRKNENAVKSELDAKASELAELEAKIPVRRSAMREEERQHTDILLGLQDRIGTSRKENEAITADIEAKRKEHAEKTAWILGEEERLSIRERDIAIYEQRVREKGKELDPNFEMIL
jgi:DNA-binding ferritin-like protein